MSINVGTGVIEECNQTAASMLGQHKEEILQELGVDWDDITRLKSEGVVT